MLRRKRKHLSEEEAELLEYERTGGEAGVRSEKEIVFGLTGMASFVTIFLFAWAVFKLVWFHWLGMPGWW